MVREVTSDDLPKPKIRTIPGLEGLSKEFHPADLLRQLVLAKGDVQGMIAQLIKEKHYIVKVVERTYQQHQLDAGMLKSYERLPRSVTVTSALISHTPDRDSMQIARDALAKIIQHIDEFLEDPESIFMITNIAKDLQDTLSHFRADEVIIEISKEDEPFDVF